MVKLHGSAFEVAAFEMTRLLTPDSNIQTNQELVDGPFQKQPLQQNL